MQTPAYNKHRNANIIILIFMPKVLQYSLSQIIQPHNTNTNVNSRFTQKTECPKIIKQWFQRVENQRKYASTSRPKGVCINKNKNVKIYIDKCCFRSEETFNRITMKHINHGKNSCWPINSRMNNPIKISFS